MLGYHCLCLDICSLQPFCYLTVMLPPFSSVSPLSVQHFTRDLRHNPNPQLVAFILDGLRDGFKFGFSHSQKLRSAKRSKPSAYECPSVIDEYLANEMSLGRVAGPFNSPPLPSLYVSSFGSTRQMASDYRPVILGGLGLA